jgi:hypothetical protein
VYFWGVVPVLVPFGSGTRSGWLVTTLGVGLSVVGWYQISGQPTEAQQLPYLASATIPGAALIVAGAVMLTGGRATERVSFTRQPRPRAADTALWGLPAGSYIHRAACPLLDGKPDAFQITAERIAAGTAPERACPICDPGPVGSP